MTEPEFDKTAIEAVPTVDQRYRVVPPPEEILSSLTFSCLFATPPARDGIEGVYHRYLQREDGSGCLQTIIFYKLQVFPYHLHDYVPLFLFIDENATPVALYYDSGHHRASQRPLDSPLHFTVFGPWHSFLVDMPRWMRRDFEYEWVMLDDTKIRQWWYRDGKSQLKLREKLQDPWRMMQRREQEAGPSFRDTSWCPVCGSVNRHDDMDVRGTIFHRLVICPNGHSYFANYDPELVSMTSAEEDEEPFSPEGP